MKRLLLVVLALAFFTLTAHADSPLPGWKVINGQWTAEGKAVVGQNGFLVNEQDTWKNFKLAAQVQIVEWGEGAAGFRLRATLRGKPENCYRLLLRKDQGVTFDKMENGNWTPLHATKVSIPPGQWFKVGFAIKGGRMQVSLNGKKIYTFTDKEPIIEGAIILWVQQPKAAFKDIKIKAMK